jgi:hypothetical protein
VTDFIVFPGVNGDNVFDPEIRQAIADSPELQAAFAPVSGSENYASQVAIMAMIASKLNVSEKGIALGLATLDGEAKLLEVNLPNRLSDEYLKTNMVTQWKPHTFYSVDTSVVNPNGEIVKVKSAHTSDDVYNDAFWSHPAIDGGTP